MAFDLQGARVDVDFVANTGQFHRANAEVRAEYGRTTAVLSDESLRAALAAEKLDRAIAASGPTSTRAKAATLAYRKEMRDLQVQATRTAEAETAANRERRSARRTATPGTLAYSRANSAEEAALAGAGGNARGGRRAAGSTLHEEERKLGRFGRGALAGSGLASGLGRAVSFASSAFLGGAGLVFAIHKTIEASREEEVQLALVRQALHANGLSWRQYGGQIEEATKRLEDHSAFTRTELNATLAGLIRRTGDVNKAIQLTGTATDLARGKQIDLATASGVLIKAVNGQTGALRRMGLNVVTVTTAQDKLHASGQKVTAAQIAQAKAADKAATIQGILAGVQQKYGGAAARYLQTEAGKQALLNARLHDSEVIIGNALKPAISKLVGSLADWIDKMNRTGKLQRDVNHAVRVGTAAAHGLHDGLRVVRSVVTPLNHALGGTRHTVELLAIAFAGLKLAKLAGELRGVAGAWRGVRTAAYTAGVAEEVAGGLPGRGPGRAAKGGRGLLRKILGPAAVGLGSAVGGEAAAVTALAIGTFLAGGEAGKQTKRLYNSLFGGGGHHDAAAGEGSVGLSQIDSWLRDPTVHFALSGNGDVLVTTSDGRVLHVYKASDRSIEADVARRRARLSGPAQVVAANRAVRAALSPKHHANARGAGSKPPATPPPPAVGSSYATQLELSRAGLTAGQADDLAAYKRQEAELRRQLRQKGLTRQDRLQITDELGGVLDQERSIAEQRQQSQQAAAAKRRERAKQQAEKEREREKKRRERAKQQAEKEREREKKQRAAELKRLTSAPIELRIAEQTALAHHAGEEKLLAIYRRELHAIERQIELIKKQHLGKQAVLSARHAEAEVQRKIDKLTKKAGSGSGRSFYDEAGSEFAEYGSNIGGRHAPLSSQDARALLAVIARSMGDVAEHTRRTASHTHTISRSKPSAIHHARDAALSGY